MKVAPLLIDYKQYLLKAIKICGSSQTTLGKLSGIPRQKINYLLNRGKKMKFEDAWAIQKATNNQVEMV